MKITLALYDQSTKVKDFVLREEGLVIGRSAAADISLEDRWVSRRHCKIEVCDGLVMVRDLGSRHGILVNDHPVTEAKLLPGDTLRVGLSKFVASYAAENAGHKGGVGAACDR